MRALVMYESMFGNTEAVARAVADGMARLAEVTVVDVGTMPLATGVDVIVLGGPTHAFGLSRPATRQDAVRQGATRDDAATVGLREWLDAAPALSGVPAAVFDTRVDKRFSGSAARKAERRLRRLGCRMLVAAQSFHVVGTPGPLVDGERERARRWGEAVVAAAVAATPRT
ncbi:flavodoxin family protein [Micromonospora sp. WMMD729]|uniref:flavodoxin family protein n=1 Tax=Micromonospora sp. WMMD729 TaxID=3404127 RepID=UPI003BF4C78D